MPGDGIEVAIHVQQGQVVPQGSGGDQAVDQLPQLSLAQIAVNLASERETDLRPSKALQESQVVRMNSETWLSKPLWFYLTIAACLLTCVEWFLYHRRYIS